MRYKITHTTTYNYSEPVAVSHNRAFLTPRSDERQTCQYHRLVIKPTPPSPVRRNDYFDNQQHFFAIHDSFRRLSITAISRVRVHPPAPPEPGETQSWEEVAAELSRRPYPPSSHPCQFRYPSPSITPTAEMAAYAGESFTKKRPILKAAIELTSRIHEDFEYDPTTTDITTPLATAFEQRSGVCQDLAHVQIACLRSIGLAARYVSGYLRTIPPEGKPRLVGADASHAWLSIYCGDAGWLDLDPTNDCLALTDHITVAWGRDYGDVAPLSGTYLGGGTQQLTVSVDVAPQD